MSRDSKLKPIYDYIDNCNYKKALGEIDKLLKKTKDVQYVKSLRALCLVRLNRHPEGQVVLDELAEQSMTDEAALQAMTMAYLDMNQPENVAKIYDSAVKKDPRSEKLLTHLFMSYVRLKDYNKQKLTALNLYKACPKNPYYFWAVMSIFSQAQDMEDQDMANKIVLPLAEKMCKKFYDEGKYESEAEIELHLMILEKQNKYSEMIELIDSDIGKRKLKDYLGFVLYRKVGLLVTENRLKEAFDVLLTLIEGNIDQYNYYLEAFELAEKLSVDNGLEYIERLWKFIEKNCSPPADQTGDNYYLARKSRGPYMVQIIVAQKLLQNPKFSAFALENIKSESFVVDMLLEYFNTFGHKLVCFKDMFFMFQKTAISKTSIEDLLLKIQLSVTNLNDNDLDDIQRYICYLYLKFYISTPEENAKFLRENKTNLYERHLKVYQIMKEKKLEKDIAEGGMDKPLDQVMLNEKEQCPFDSIVHLFMLFFATGVDLYSDPAAEEMALDLLSFLEVALSKNNMDFYTKLFLARLYSVVGAGACTHKLFKALEVKHLLIDSLGFHFMQPVLSSGVFDNGGYFLSYVYNFYLHSCKDYSDFIITCYRYGSFSKIAEMFALYEKLNNSLQYYLVLTERFSSFWFVKNNDDLNKMMWQSLKILNKVNKQDIVAEKIQDNRDMTIYTSNLCQESYVDEMKQKSKQAEVLYIQYRVELSQAVSSVFYLLNSFCKQNQLLNDDSFVQYDNITVESLSSTLSSLETVLKNGREFCTNHDTSFFFQGPPPSRLFAYMKSCHNELISPLLNYLSDVLSYLYQRSDSLEFNVNTEELSAKFTQELTSLKPSSSFAHIRKFIEYSSLSLETFSLLVALIEIVSVTLTNLKPGKKFKKLNDNFKLQNYESTIQSISENVAVLGKFVDEAFTQLRGSFKSYDDKYFQWIQHSKLNTFGDFEEVVTMSGEIKKKLLASYTQALNEQVTALDYKQKYLKQLPIMKN